MIESLFAIALAIAVPLGVLLTLELLGDEPASRRRALLPVGFGAAAAIAGLAAGRGAVGAVLAVPWWFVVGGSGLVVLVRVVRDLTAGRLRAEPWRISVAIAVGFLVVGTTWLIIDRAGLQPFGFGRTIVLLTAVHFHVAGFVLTLAGALAARERPGRGIHIALAALVVGTPLTALGFFGLPIVSWVGATLVAAGGIGIGIATVMISRRLADSLARPALLVGGGTLFVTMPLAVGYATGTTFGIPFLDIPAMAAIHGGLNVVAFAVPTMVGWTRATR